MAEISVGDIVAHLRLEAAQFEQGIRAALQQLAQFQQQLSSAVSPLTQFQQALQRAPQQAQQAFQAFNQTLGQTNQTVTTFNQTFTQAVNVLNQAQQGAQRFGSTWQNVLQIAAGVGLATTVQGLARAFINFASDSVQLAARMQDLNRSFTALQGSGTAANQTLAFLFQTAQRVGISFTEAAEGFRRLEAGARGTVLTSSDLQRAFEGLTTGARALGLSNQQVGSAIQALEQILTKGKLSSEELVRQLGNAVPGALQTTANVLGVTTAQLRAMTEAGLIPGTVAVIAFTEGMRELGKAAGPLEGLTQTFAQLKNETTAWMTAIGESVGSVLEPFLRDVIKISEEVRKLLGIRGPGQQGAPGASSGGLGPLAPGTLGMPAPGTTGPTERPGSTQFNAPLSFASSRFDTLVQQAAERRGVDPVVLSNLLRVESNFDPTAVSPKGALGLGQLMPDTARQLRPGITRAQILEPATNIDLAAQYLGQLTETFKRFDDRLQLSLAAYNAGPGSPNRPGTILGLLAQQEQAGRPATFAAIQERLPSETQPFPGRILTPPGTGPAVSRVQEAQAQTVEVWKRTIADTLEQFPLLQQQINQLIQSGANFGGTFNREVVSSADKLFQKLLDINQAFATIPILAGQIPEKTREEVVEATRVAAIWKESLLTDQQRRDMLRQQVEQVEQLTIRRQAELVAARQGQQEAERFTRLETARLAQERLKDRPEQAGLTIRQQIADLENRLVGLQNRAATFGQQLEVQRAQQMRPQLEAQLQQIEALMGRPGQSLAAQAAANVETQFAQARKTLETTLQELARNPALQDMQEKFQNALQGLGEAAAQQSQIAAERIDNQQRLRVEAMGDQIQQIGERIKGAGLDPLDAALSAIGREFSGMVNQLDALQRALEELAKTATTERQAEIAGQISALEAIRQQAPEGRERREAQARFRLEFLPSLEEPRAQSEELDTMRNQLEDMRTQLLNQQQGPFGLGRVQTRQERVMMERFSPENKVEAEEIQAQLRAQERLNYAAELFGQVAGNVGSAWVNALDSIATGTATVSEAFRAMAQSIIQSLGQIAAQEGFKALIRLGFGLIAGGATGGLAGGPTFGAETGGGAIFQAPVGGGAPFIPPPIAFAGGGIVQAPTRALVGESGPEAVMSQPQMADFLAFARASGPSAGGQASGGVSIHNYSTKAEAEAGVARDRAQGKEAVLNAVLGDLQQGSASRIHRAITTLQR